MTFNPLLRLSLRGVLAWCLLSAVGFIFARPITSALSPFIENVIDAMQADFIAHLSIVDARGGPRLAMSCTATHELLLPNGKIVPLLGSINCAYADAVHALVPLIIFAVAVVGWPIRNRGEVLRRMVGSVLLLPVVVALTTPVQLVGLVERALHPDSFRADAQLAALIHPWVFMEMGGRWLLPLVAAVACIRFAAMKSKNGVSQTK